MVIVNHSSAMRLLEEETGEIIGDVIEKGDKLQIIRKATADAAKKLKESVPCNSGRNFVKQFPDKASLLCRRLTPNEIWLLNALTPYVGINSGILRHRNGAFLTRKQVQTICEVVFSRATADRAITGLVKKGILAKCTVKEKKAFIMNPYVMQNGSRANATLLALFKDTEWVYG